MCSVWISEQALIIHLYGIHLTVFVAKKNLFLLRDGDWIFKYYT